MKPKLLSIGSSLLIFILLIFSGCRKDTQTQETLVQENAVSGEEAMRGGKDDNEGCQITKAEFGDGFYYQFLYNNKGLAKEWKIVDEIAGTTDKYTMEYDNHNKLVKSKVTFADGSEYRVQFIYQWGRIAKELWYEKGSSEVFEEIKNIYGNDGRMIKRETSSGVVVKYKLNAIGTTLIEFYSGVLLYTAEYTFYQPNRNPWLAIRGVPYGFPFYAFSFDKWWETSEKLTFYTDGIPEVIFDYDPRKTVIQTGPQNYVTKVRNYDRVSQSWSISRFNYQNCGKRNDDCHCDKTEDETAASATTGDDKLAKAIKMKYKLLSGPLFRVKSQIESLRKK